MWLCIFLYKRFLIKQMNSLLLPMQLSENESGKQKHMDRSELIHFNLVTMMRQDLKKGPNKHKKY